jgi:hypothetical protein
VVDGVVRALLLLAIAACGTEQATSPYPDVSTLSTDTYFTFTDGTAPCDEPVIDACIYELGFCADGTYAYKLADVITDGTYNFDEMILLDSSSGFQFDLPSDYSDDASGNVIGPWNITSLENDPDVACL